MDDDNPYSAPASIAKNSLSEGDAHRRAGALTYVAWVFVFAINMALPLLFSSLVTREHGKLGMSVAALVLLGLGCYVCAAGQKHAVALIAGGALVGLAQLFPFLQLIAGLIGMKVGEALGLADNGGNDERSPQIINEYGGFIVTFVTGGLLMAAGASIGLLLRLVTPARWWPKSEQASNT